MGYRKKKSNFEKALQNNKFDDIIEFVDQNENFAFYQGKITYHNVNMLFSMWLADNLLNDLDVTIGVLENTNKKEQLLELFNDFNREESLMKFIIDKENYLHIHSCYLADDDTFNGEILITIIRRIVNTLDESYHKKIMRVLWA